MKGFNSTLWPIPWFPREIEILKNMNGIFGRTVLTLAKLSEPKPEMTMTFLIMILKL